MVNIDQTNEDSINIHPEFSGLDILPEIRIDPLVSIVIPVYNGIDYVPHCVQSFFHAGASIRFEVICVDNHSTDGTREMLLELEKNYQNLKVILNKENHGFATAINQGNAVARGEFLAICNSDIIVSPGWLDRLLVAMNTEPKIAVVSPITNNVGEGPQLDPESVNVTPDSVNLYAQQIAHREEIIFIVDRLVFFCVLLRKKIFDLLGGLSSSFGLGNFEDDDFCLRARMMGYKLAIEKGAFVYHYGSRTFKDQRLDHDKWLQKNAKIYYDRIARFSSQIPLLTRNQIHSSPEVSVIVRTKNRPFPLHRALTSLANQTFNQFEVILINDGGVDILPIIQNFKNFLTIKYISNKKPVGRAPALNLGLKHSEGQWITYLDDDDIIYPLHLELLMDAINRSPEKSVYTETNKALYWSDRNQNNIVLISRIPFISNREFSHEELLVDNWIPIMSFMHSKEILDLVGTFDENFEIYEDWDFLIRLSRKIEFHKISRTSCEYRFQFGNKIDDSTLLSRKKAAQMRTLIYKKYPTTVEEIIMKRNLLINEVRSQNDYINKTIKLQITSINQNLLIVSRLGGFLLPKNLGK